MILILFFRWCMLPSFISRSQAEKVLSTGKSLNFLRNVCHFRDPISGRDAIKKALEETTGNLLLRNILNLSGLE